MISYPAPRLADKEHQYAMLTKLGEQKRDAGHDAVSRPASDREPADLDITVDARTLGSECLAADAAAVHIRRIGRKPRLRHQVDRLTGPGDWFEPVRIRLSQQNDGRKGFAAVDRSVADALVQIVLGLGTKDGLVGRTDGAKHPVEPAHRPFATLARGLMVEIVECKGDVCGHAFE
jgi:hypothetical protein